MDNIPNGYKKTEIGVIPEDWEVKAIGDVTKIFGRIGFRGYTVNDIVEEDEGAISLSPSNIHDNTINFKDSTYISWEKYEESPEIKIYNGDVILVKTGSTVGKVAMIKNLTKKATLNPQIVVFKKINIKNELFFYLLISRLVQEQLKTVTVGGALPTLSQKQVEKFKIPLSRSKDECIAIADSLSDIDSLITSLEKLIEKKKMIRQGVMQELLTGKRRLPGFNGDWRKVTLGNIAKFGKGKGLAKKDILSSGKKECIHYGELFTIYGTQIQNIYSKTNIDGDNYLSSDNDVLMPTSDVTPTGLAKASCIRQNGVILGGGILVIRLDDGFDGEFLSMKIRQDKNQILQLVTGTTVFHIYERDMNQFEFSTPEYDEQVAIVHKINDMNDEVDRLTEKLSKLKQIKQGAMQQLLTGKIRLINK